MGFKRPRVRIPPARCLRRLINRSSAVIETPIRAIKATAIARILPKRNLIRSSTPEEDDIKVYEKEWREMRHKKMGELLKIKFTTGNDYTKFLVDMEFERRTFVRDVMIDRCVAGLALVVSIILPLSYPPVKGALMSTSERS